MYAHKYTAAEKAQVEAQIKNQQKAVEIALVAYHNAGGVGVPDNSTPQNLSKIYADAFYAALAELKKNAN